MVAVNQIIIASLQPIQVVESGQMVGFPPVAFLTSQYEIPHTVEVYVGVDLLLLAQTVWVEMVNFSGAGRTHVQGDGLEAVETETSLVAIQGIS